MSNRLLLGFWRLVLSLPRPLWQGQVDKSARDTIAGLDFMSAQHHQVRDFVVRELPRVGRPLSPGLIAESLALPLDQVVAILDELERHMTFLFRNEQGEVAWAYPVTVDRTVHHVTFHTGEQVYAA